MIATVITIFSSSGRRSRQGRQWRVGWNGAHAAMTLHPVSNRTVASDLGTHVQHFRGLRRMVHSISRRAARVAETADVLCVLSAPDSMGCTGLERELTSESLSGSRSKSRLNLVHTLAVPFPHPYRAHAQRPSGEVSVGSHRQTRSVLERSGHKHSVAKASG